MAGGLIIAGEYGFFLFIARHKLTANRRNRLNLMARRRF
jgi:hypothetical protein